MYGLSIRMALGLMSLTIGCATPDNASSIRDQKPFSIGFPGGYVRPTDSLSLGVKSYTDNKPDYLVYSASAEQSAILDAASLEYDRVTNSYFAHYYPSKASGLFLGVSLARMVENVNFEYQNEQSELQRVDYTSAHHFVAPLLGFDWIWKNGLTVGLDVGTYYLLDSSYKHDSKESEANAKTIAGKAIVDTLEKLSLTTPVSCRWFLGFSF